MCGDSGLFPSLRLTNGYGPTETTTFACTHAILSDTQFSTGSVPIGRPLANTSCRILDHVGQPTPVGVPGELHIGGDGLAIGYWNQPDLTAERFVLDPFSEEPGARLYKTGDFARYLPDGSIEFLGRRDQQVKIRGFRIELGEIEAALATHADVQACAVVALHDGNGERSMSAFVVPSERANFSAHATRSWLSGILPDYMLPSRFVVLNELPLTPNGKVDRRALECIQGEELAVDTQYVPPRTELERSWPASGGCYCIENESAFTTTSSNWAGILCYSSAC